MRRHPAELLYFFLALLATGCVARSEHLRAQQEFENARNMIARQSAELDAVRRQQGLADERNDRRDEVEPYTRPSPVCSKNAPRGSGCSNRIERAADKLSSG